MEFCEIGWNFENDWVEFENAQRSQWYFRSEDEQRMGQDRETDDDKRTEQYTQTRRHTRRTISQQLHAGTVFFLWRYKAKSRGL